MQSQDLSYKLNNYSFQLGGFEGATVSFEIFSMDNVFTLDKDAVHFDGEYFSCNKIIWGNNEKQDTSITGRIDNHFIDLTADTSFAIRSVKTRFDNLPLGKLVSLIDGDHEITEYGMVLHYPEGWRSLSHPLLIFEINENRYLYIRSLDKTVNRKSFLIKKENGKLRVDFVQEQKGTELGTYFKMPSIEISYASSKEEIIKKQAEYMEKTYSLVKYEKNKDIPSWFRDISLVVTMHMETFTGYVFHTYEQMYQDIRRLTEYIEPRRILVYLAGWEGRYYYKYGNYSPDERMGGKESLKYHIKKIKDLGCHVIAMYGMNIANKTLSNIARICDKAEFQSISGAKYHNGSVDWEGAHHYDFNELCNLNIANPLWADELFRQIKENTLEYDFDGAFLDIAACYVNDKNHSLYEGVVAFANRLRTIKPDFLVSGEGFYDGLAKAMPLFQSGHTDGLLHYHDRLGEEIFTDYVREFAHLCLGDPSRGSSGVHELGTNDIYDIPLRKGLIPTISLVENSIDESNPRFREIIEHVKEYTRKYLDD